MSNIRNRKPKYLGFFILVITTFFMLYSPLWARGSQELKVSEQLIMIDFDNENDVFAVRELYEFNNTSPGISSGDLLINLPDGATNIYIGKKDSSEGTETIELDPNKYFIQDGRVTISEEIASGRSKFILIFYTIESLEDARTLNYLTDKVYVYVPLRFSFSSDKLHNLGIEILEEAHYQALGAENLNKGDSYLLEIDTAQKGERVIKEYQSITGLHSVTHLNRWANSPLSNINPHLWLFFLLVLAIVVLVFFIILLRKHESKTPDNIEDIQYLLAKQSRLIQRIKELDLQLNKGEIEQETYEELRKQYKELLVKVKLRLKSLGEG